MNTHIPHKPEVSVEKISNGNQENEWRVIFGNQEDNQIVIPEPVFKFLVDNGVHSKTNTTSIIQALGSPTCIYSAPGTVIVERENRNCHITVFTKNGKRFCNCTFIQFSDFLWHIGTIEYTN